MKSLPSDSIDLIYIDPPFFCQKDFKNKDGVGFNDSWPSRDAYLNFIRARIDQCHILLKDTGSLFIHLDQKASHYIKVELDKIFGENNFINEIIWSYKTYQGKVDQYFPKKHDNIFWYRKNSKEKSFFKLPYCDNYKDTINFRRWKKYFVMEKGNPVIKYGKHPTSDSRFDAYLKRWKKENARMPKSGEIIYRQTGEVITDVWNIQAIDPKDKKEKLGYLTQKPLALLERIIKSCTMENSVVADFFCGSGTTLVAAKNLNRKYIGCDINQDAIDITNKRLLRCQ